MHDDLRRHVVRRAACGVRPVPDHLREAEVCYLQSGGGDNGGDDGGDDGGDNDLIFMNLNLKLYLS